jgi:hypothetical protein
MIHKFASRVDWKTLSLVLGQSDFEKQRAKLRVLFFKATPALFQGQLSGRRIAHPQPTSRPISRFRPDSGAAWRKKCGPRDRLFTEFSEVFSSTPNLFPQKLTNH